MLKLAKELLLPVSAVTQKFAFMGRSSSGKTYGSTKLAEEMLLIGAQIMVLDVVGNWYGLRIPKDKRNAPFDIHIFGGRNADIEINPKAGKIVAGVLVEKNLSAVIDISEFIEHEQMRFTYDFLTELFRLRKETPRACHLFIEEAQELVPQTLPPSQKGEESFGAKMLHAAQRILKIGRNYGIGATIITQRPQDVNKKVLNQTEVLLAFQMTGIQEKKTIAEWIRDKGEDENLADNLSKLEVGNALVWSPAWLKVSGMFKIAEKITADVSATPEVGVDAPQTQKLAPRDVSELSESIKALTVEMEANTPAALKKQIADLTGQINKMSKSVNSAPAVAAEPVEVRVEVPVFPLEARKDIDEFVASTAGNIQSVRDDIDRLTDYFVTGFTRIVDKYANLPSAVASPSNDGEKQEQAKWRPDTRAIPAQKKPATTSHAAVAADSGAISSSGSHLPEGERKILIVIAQYSDRGGATREQISILTGYARSSRNTYISRLVGKGLIETGTTLTATDQGIRELGTSYERLPEGPALQEWWLNRLPEGEAKILTILLNSYPNAVDRDTISNETGYARSSRNTYISRLSTKRLVNSTSSGVTASDDFF